MKKEIDQSVYDQVGHIRIKEPKKKNNNKKKDGLPLWQKIFVWAMFVAMLAGFVVPLVLYFINYAVAE